MHRLLILLVCLLPLHIAHGAVVISEVAWMGGLDSANDEWIELHNTGETVSVDGWVLSDGFGLEIELAGSVAAGQFAVLERSDDASAPGVAFLIYTGSLGNDGRTLTLRRADGGVEDQVAGGAAWEGIGGDNTTKETPQLTSSGWVTAPATPGTANESKQTTTPVTAVADEPEPKAVVAAPAVAKTGSGNNETISMQHGESKLQLEIAAPSVGYPHQSLDFAVQATGLGRAVLDSLQYQWNFGNLHTATGEETAVSYAHPGTYVVIAEAVYGTHRAEVRHEITILPTALSLAWGDDGAVYLHNDSQFEVDVSGFVLHAHDSVTFPPLSFITARGTLPLGSDLVTRNMDAYVSLKDRSGSVVATLLPKALRETVAASSAVVAPAVAAVPVTYAPPLPSSPVLAERGREAVATTSVVQLAAPATTLPLNNPRLPYLILTGLLLLAVVALYARGVSAYNFRSESNVLFDEHGKN